MWHSRPPRAPPPFMANTILNFHFDYLITSLIQLFDGLSPFFAGHTHDEWLIIISFFSLQDTVIKVGWKLDACSVAAALRPAVEKPGPPHLTWKISQNIEPHTKHLKLFKSGGGPCQGLQRLSSVSHVTFVYVMNLVSQFPNMCWSWSLDNHLLIHFTLLSMNLRKQNWLPLMSGSKYPLTNCTTAAGGGLERGRDEAKTFEL